MEKELRLRVLLVKMGVDWMHDAGIRWVSSILKDSGMEVIYLGYFQTAESVIKVAQQEDVDVIGVSAQAGEHLSHVPELLNLIKERDLKFPVIIGGVIPQVHVSTLKEQGAAGVFPSGATAEEIVKCIDEIAHNRSK